MPVPPAVLCRMGWLIVAEPTGVLSYQVYAVVYVVWTTRSEDDAGTTGAGAGFGATAGTAGAAGTVTGVFTAAAVLAAAAAAAF